MEITRHLINTTDTASTALEKLNNLGDELTLFVVNNGAKLVGTITDGDIRRGFLNNLKLGDKVSGFMNPNFKFLRVNEINTGKLHDFKMIGVKLVPILDESDRVVRILNLNQQVTLLPVNAIIMAGGEGVRLRPLTTSTPKPLLKIGHKPIIDYGIDQLVKYGIDNISICTNYLSDHIISYLGEGTQRNITIEYIIEEKKLGTIGAVSLIDNFKHDCILVMNADLLTNINLEEFYHEFMRSGASMSVACTPYKVDIPYAILEIDKSYIRSLKEKPTFTYYSNAGIYLIKKDALSHIPYNTHFNATDLIEHLIKIDQKVTYFPILGYWLDIGSMDDFQKAQEDIKYFIL